MLKNKDTAIYYDSLRNCDNNYRRNLPAFRNFIYEDWSIDVYNRLYKEMILRLNR